jgi:hypothetical protein
MKSRMLKKLKLKTVMGFKSSSKDNGYNDTDPTGVTIMTVTHISSPLSK